jgi:hypothetical protein
MIQPSNYSTMVSQNVMKKRQALWQKAVAFDLAERLDVADFYFRQVYNNLEKRSADHPNSELDVKDFITGHLTLIKNRYSEALPAHQVKRILTHLEYIDELSTISEGALEIEYTFLCHLAKLRIRLCAKLISPSQGLDAWAQAWSKPNVTAQCSDTLTEELLPLLKAIDFDDLNAVANCINLVMPQYEYVKQDPEIRFLLSQMLLRLTQRQTMPGTLSDSLDYVRRALAISPDNQHAIQLLHELTIKHQYLQIQLDLIDKKLTKKAIADGGPLSDLRKDANRFKVPEHLKVIVVSQASSFNESRNELPILKAAPYAMSPDFSWISDKQWAVSGKKLGKEIPFWDWLLNKRDWKLKLLAVASLAVLLYSTGIFATHRISKNQRDHAYEILSSISNENFTQIAKQSEKFINNLPKGKQDPRVSEVKQRFEQSFSHWLLSEQEADSSQVEKYRTTYFTLTSSD